MLEEKAPLPTRNQCYELFEKYETPEKVITHCETVNKVARCLASRLKDAGILVNVALVDRASLLHDIARVSDHHAQKGAEILRKEGYPKIAEIISRHRYDTIGKDDFETWEEKIVYYADKRATHKIVSIKERTARWMEKYSNYKNSIQEKLPKVRKLENEIFNHLSIRPNELNEKITTVFES